VDEEWPCPILEKQNDADELMSDSDYDDDYTITEHEVKR